MKKHLPTIIAAIVLIASAGGLYAIRGDSPQPEQHNNQSEQAKSPDEDAQQFVYEFDAESPEDCTSVETYDNENKVCYFECDSQSECDELLAKAEMELNEFIEKYSANSSERSEEVPENIETRNDSAIYAVAADESITLNSGEDSQTNQTVWADISMISPDSFSASYIERFATYNDPEDSTIAYIVDDDENGKFNIGVNLAAYLGESKREQALTIVHELAHIATLNQDQAALGACDYQTDEGCFGEDSMLARFVNRFWNREDITKAQNEEDVYAGNEESFITEYAATNPEEDVAESFAYYVVRSDYSGADVASQKLAFFEEFKQAESLKKDMRKAVLDIFLRSRIQ